MRELKSCGLIKVMLDPSDHRAVLVRPTERGRAFLEVAAEVRRELEQWYIAKLRPDLAQHFMQIISRLAEPSSS